MKIDNLKEWVLLEPAKNGFTELFISRFRIYKKY